ncbi:MAG: type II toxin-antitoxin system Phd/YefM family antitoxin [Candidatus Tectomicrobia bacterium]|uniref:Antitoxin n=1 Tax=Tectimicrobiota bacterium TaxID=2528274 RepID=A0A932CMR0_UNCTE|nr:type II toxin-antitoxin system Phd/YefM family antitoxin [Candidatus Tectomicrobia bacterium]
MSTTRIGIAEAKNALSTIVNRVAFGRERIILESRGKPKAAVISIEDLQRLESWEPEITSTAARMSALAEARAVRQAIAARQGAPDSESVVDTLHRLREERTLALEGEES